MLKSTHDKDSSSYQTLISLAKCNRDKYHIEYAGFLTNHNAFGLLALYKMGGLSKESVITDQSAPASRLQQFYDIYTKRLEPKIPSQSKINKDNYKEYWGQDKYFEDYFEFFQKEIQDMGTYAFIEYYFREASEGLFGAAFHGIIALGHGIQIGDIDEIAFGMAYIYFSHQAVGTLSQNPPVKLDKLDVPDLILQIQNEKVFDSLENIGFQKTLSKMLENPDYMNIIAKYDLDIPDGSDLTSVLWAFILTITKLFAFTGGRDFFLLHGVTSCWSIISTFTHIRDNNMIVASLRSYWRALVMTYIIQGRKKFVPLEEPEMQKELGHFVDWNSFFERTRDRTNDEHLLKVVYMVKEFEDEWKKAPLDGQPRDTHLFKYASIKCADEFFGNNSHWIYS